MLTWRLTITSKFASHFSMSAAMINNHRLLKFTFSTDMLASVHTRERETSKLNLSGGASVKGRSVARVGRWRRWWHFWIWQKVHSGTPPFSTDQCSRRHASDTNINCDLGLSHWVWTMSWALEFPPVCLSIEDLASIIILPQINPHGICYLLRDSGLLYLLWCPLENEQREWKYGRAESARTTHGPSSCAPELRA